MKRFQWFVRHKIITALIVIVIIIVAASSSSSKPKDSTSNRTSNPPASTAQQESASSQPPAKPAERQVTGTAVTLGAGTFTGGQDVKAGLYDVTAPGQQGNFQVSGADEYNEILGGADLGVPKIRVQISSGDKIELSSLTAVTFTPVTAPFVTAHSAAQLYAGTWVVGQDIGAGRYVAKPGAGQSGNFITSGGTNEILGGQYGVPQVTVNLSNGDIITISSLSEVDLTPQ